MAAAIRSDHDASDFEPNVFDQRPASSSPARRQAPAAAVAVHLAREQVGKHGMLVHLASSERRAEEIGRALADLAPDIEVLVLPPWDCLPYDRASPSREIMGRRMAVLRRLSDKADSRILLLSPESLVQRVPPPEAVAVTFDVMIGKPLDRDVLLAFAAHGGYLTHDRVDEPGEIAMLGEVVDVYPANAVLPTRIGVDGEGIVADLRTYDPLSQRTHGDVTSLTLGAASELVQDDADGAPRQPGIEHRMAKHYETMRSVFDIVPKAKATRDPCSNRVWPRRSLRSPTPSKPTGC